MNPWVTRMIDLELELRHRALRLFRGTNSFVPPPVRPVGPHFMTDVMSLDEQDGIELAAFAEHRGQPLIAESYRADAGYEHNQDRNLAW